VHAVVYYDYRTPASLAGVRNVMPRWCTTCLLHLRRNEQAGLQVVDRKSALQVRAQHFADSAWAGDVITRQGNHARALVTSGGRLTQ
jgi:hypothetical protein